MKADFDAGARKRPVNLTLNEDLVSQAKSMTDNLSGVVEALLSRSGASPWCCIRLRWFLCRWTNSAMSSDP
jgi:Post-segregation antitoxin CcdA